jgi:hypothetical protein
MPYRIFISLLICLQTIHTYSQDTLRYNSKWQIGASINSYAQMTPFFKGAATDHLIEFDKSTLCSQLSLSYFFHKHWGIGIDLLAGSSINTAQKAGHFTESMQSQYERDYYVTTSTGENYGRSKFNIERGYFNVIYRLESARFFIYPKLAIGVISFYSNWGQAYLKRKNANDVIEISYTPNKIPQDYFTIATSASTGYKLSKRIFLNIEPLISFHKTGLTYTQTTTDLNSKQSVMDIISYKRNALSVAVSGGVIVVLK